MHKGTIVELTERSSGFIRRVGIKTPLFFHADDLLEVSFTDLKKGDTLTFTVVENRQDPYAVQIRRTGKSKR